MSKTVTAAVAAASMLISGVAAPAMAQNYRYDRYYQDRDSYNRGYNSAYRRGYYDARRYDRGYYDRRYNDRRYYRRDRNNNGAALAAGVLGFALGAAIVGSQRSPNYGTNAHHNYCASKYRSYDPRSGTYLGYDGYRRYCR